VYRITDPLISRPIAHRYSDSLPGQPTINGMPVLGVLRSYTSLGVSRQVGSVAALRIKTEAPIIELTGVTPEGGRTVQTLVVDGRLVPPKVLSADRGFGGGWAVSTIRIAFGTRRLRDIWIETQSHLAFLKVGKEEYLLPVDDANEPQLTAVGDSYLQSLSDVFGNGGAIALSVGARLGLRKVATDSVGATGYHSTGGGLGNFNDRLPAHAQDSSQIYLVIGGINDYGDAFSGSGLRWPSQTEYESNVRDYLRGLRSARPNALIVVTAPFCPIPSLSDASFVASAFTNASGLGDNLYKANVHKEAVRAISPPWVYIDVLMGTGWLNSSGATGDVTNLQWFTGGTPAPNTTATHKPGNTNGGGGGGFGGIDSVPVLSGGRYRQAPEIMATGGSGRGLLLCGRIDGATGALTSVPVVCPGYGYTAAGLPTISIDPTFESEPAILGTPTLTVGLNPGGQYPLLEFAPPGATAAELNNIYHLLQRDLVHPSPVGTEHIARRLASNIYDAVMAM
jgi:lysophospholipase L1-like esterase